MTAHVLPILIAGAGPGGLAAALALHQRGLPVRVAESVRVLRPLGVGINLLPHSVAVLRALGLQQALESQAVHTRELRYTNKLGQLVWAEPRGLAAGYPVPQLSIHRGALQMTLLDAARARIGAHAIQTDAALEAWVEQGDHLEVTLRHGDGTTSTVAALCLIAADGIHSAARRHLYPAECEPIYAGRVLWRGVTWAPPFLGGATMTMSGHQDQKFVCYPISPQPDAQGRVLTNWVAELRQPGWRAPGGQWSREVGPAAFAPAFAGWRFDWLDVPAMIAGAGAVYEYPLVDRDPLPRWTHGRVTLLGDAAHPMYPIGSNGASQAILDAAALAECLGAHRDARDALHAYEAARREPTAAIVRANRQNGPEQVMQLAETRAPHGFTDIDAVIPLAEREAIAARYKQTAGFGTGQVKVQ